MIHICNCTLVSYNVYILLILIFCLARSRLTGLPLFYARLSSNISFLERRFESFCVINLLLTLFLIINYTYRQIFSGTILRWSICPRLRGCMCLCACLTASSCGGRWRSWRAGWSASLRWGGCSAGTRSPPSAGTGARAKPRYALART